MFKLKFYRLSLFFQLHRNVQYLTSQITPYPYHKISN